MTGKILKAVAYARFSSNMQREESIDAQIRAINAYVERSGMVLVDQYIDRAQSATNDDRPAFQQMMEDAKTGCFEAVIVHKFDRFSRNRKDSITYKAFLRQLGIRVISVLEYIDDSPESVILEANLEAFAEYYSRNLAREVEKGKRENALKGKHVGGKPPLGYDVDRSTMKLIINEHEAEAVRKIFQMHLDGEGYNAMIEELNMHGYLTKEGNPFGKNSIFSVLKNEKYYGVYIYNRSAKKDEYGKRNGHAYKDDDEVIRVEDAVPVIISKADFDRAQEIMLNRKHKQARYKAKETYLLSGKMQCGECGSSFCGNSRKERPGHRAYVSYMCQKKNHSIKCGNSEIKREVIESFVLEKLADYIYDDHKIPKILASYEKYLCSRDKDKISMLDAVKKQMSQTTKEIENIVSVIAKTGSEALIERLNETERSKKELEYRYEKLTEETGSYQVNADRLIDAFKKARQLLKTGELKQTKTMIERYVKQIVIYHDRIEVFLNLGVNTDFWIEKDKEKEHLNPPDQSRNSDAHLNDDPHQRRGYDGRVERKRCKHKRVSHNKTPHKMRSAIRLQVQPAGKLVKKDATFELHVI